MTAFLYAATVLIWGTTWIAITLQKGPVSAEASVIYRFALAAFCFFIILLVTGKLKRLPALGHQFAVIQGLCLFSTNFVFFYNASIYITSGVLSLVFATATILNVVNNFLFFGQRPTRKTLAGASLGIAGLVLVFFDELQKTQFDATTLTGLLLALAGTYCFSCGNMVSAKIQQKGFHLPSINAWGMAYGATSLTAFALVTDVQFNFDTSISYGLALIYLAVIGSVAGFSAYLTLIGRIGTEKAAYATILFPLIALSISSVYEGYQWTPNALFGLTLVLLGNATIFLRLPISDKPVNTA